MAASGEPERPERREEERVPVFGALDGEVMVFLPMAITEIARGGVQVETPFAFQIDSIHELRIALGERPSTSNRNPCDIAPVSNSSTCRRD